MKVVLVILAVVFCALVVGCFDNEQNNYEPEWVKKMVEQQQKAAEEEAAKE